MNISFNIEYRTSWGEEVRIVGMEEGMGQWNESNPLVMHTIDGVKWFTTVEIPMPKSKVIKYTYYIYKEGTPIRKEWSLYPRSLQVGDGSKRRYTTLDFWRNIPEQQYYLSSAFTECFIPRCNPVKVAKKKFDKSIVIKALCPRLNSDYALAICGSVQELGGWDVEKAIVLSDALFPEWQVELDAGKAAFPIEYKFLLYNLKEKKMEGWESNPNRYIAMPERFEEYDTFVISDRQVYFDLPAWKCAGVAIPIFSLRSKKSFGIGDFGDLKKMIDWAVKTDQKVVQILPINDTTITYTWTDSYPYNSISIYAFHPLYADLSKIGTLKDKEKATYFAEKQQALNALALLDYDEVCRLKWEFFRLIYKQDGEKTLNTEGFKQFFEANKEWLEPYAIFSYLRDLYKTPDFRLWPKYSEYTPKEVAHLCTPGKPDYEGVAIFYFIQYHLHLQLLEAAQYARRQGVVLKGDIPIGISCNSVEAWTEPHYFNMDGQAGAPPDDFSVNGQNWGFPTYNWDEMEKDGYSWWMKRFKKMAEYFDAYRIDHILGFFRIWQIPMNAVHGLLGQFVPSLSMSKEEIESYGLPFDEPFFTTPYIHEYFLADVFGPHVEYVKDQFIQSAGEWERYEMRPEFDTQRKVEAFFAGKTDPDSIWIRDGLYSLISNVLFVRDHKDPSTYHPRISVQHDFIYRALDGWKRDAFNRLYDHYYYHRHNDYWYTQAMKKLPVLTQSTRMLVCGEDLGMIPASVECVMNELRILSLEIQRMPKDPSKAFGNPEEYPYRSVCTISTHDMSTFRGWWKEDAQQTQHFFNALLGHYGAAPVEAGAELCEEVVAWHLRGNSMLCVLAWQDWLSMDDKLRNPNMEVERINVPANPKHYWRYRMHLTLEELLEANSLNNSIRKLIEQTGRNPRK